MLNNDDDDDDVLYDQKVLLPSIAVF